MPEGPDGKTIIIVKKVSGHAGHHGGAWKVAYADFITAMMALFLVLWLVNSSAEPTRQRIASYFRKPGIFQKGSGTPLQMGGGGILPEAFAPPTDGNSQIEASEKIYEVEAKTGRVVELFDPGEGSREFRHAPKSDGDSEQVVSSQTKKTSGAEGKDIDLEYSADESKLNELKTEIEKAIEENRESGFDQGTLGDIEIKVDQRGLVIEIMDTDKVSMFSSGQAVILPDARDKLIEIAKILSQVDNPIDIEGHTDGNPFKNSETRKYDNWNLATDRANAARRVFEGVGFEKGQIARVVGYADERPKDLINPLNPANRRITISMRYSGRAKVALEGKGVFETSSNKSQNKVKEIEPSSNYEIKGNKMELPLVEDVSAKTKVDQDLETQDLKSTPTKQENVDKEPSQEAGLKVEVSTVTPERYEDDSMYVNFTDKNKKTLIFESPEDFFK